MSYMRKFFVACGLIGFMSSCGSVLSLNPSYGQTDHDVVEEPVEETVVAADDNVDTSLLGSLLGSLAGNDATGANDDETALTTNGVVSGLLGSILDAFTTVGKNSLVGTWHFKGSAFVFESENALATLGSDVIAGQIESKVDQYLAKYNIKEGACTITFNADNTYQFVAGEYVVNGTYELNAETKELTLTFGMFTTTAFLVYDAGTINLVYQSDGLLHLIKSIGAKGSNRTFAMLSTLLEQYDGMRIGMAFAK